MQFDFNTLKKLWCVNDEKILQVMQSIIIGIVRDGPKFNIDYLRTHEQRKIMESYFKEVINKILSDKNKFFFDNIDPASKIEAVLLELQKEDRMLVANDSIENLFRVKIKINLKQFELHLKE
jgi:hypothetical protein